MKDYLQQFISEQKYDMYTAIDQASWRYIMRVSRAFFKDHAHAKYLDGLEATGITTERIPHISEMDEKLKRFGWRAVVVTGFIPPGVFLEFLALRTLPIACDIRTLEHLEYTPSPDIVHEAAGHAPILADSTYAFYLGKFGEISRKAIFAKEDLEVYEAILHLSDIKEDPATPQKDIDKAYERLAAAYKKVTYASEATRLSRLGWWSTEYGLVKTKDGFKIYGAGLLSSVGESYNSVHGKVPKIKLTIDCTNVDFDITKPQPQLFYIENFSELEIIIDELSSQMAYKLGGAKGLEIAQKAGTVTTAQLDSGLQMSGVVKEFETDKNGAPIYIQMTGPSQLSYDETEISGHGAAYHKDGYGTAIGNVKRIGKSLDQFTTADFINTEIIEDEKCRIEFESGVVVTGVLRSILTNRDLQVAWSEHESKQVNLVMSFDECQVTYGNKILFKPEWGIYDLACGGHVTSVFGDAADRGAYLKATGGHRQKAKAQSSNLTAENKELANLYEDVRRIREQGVLGAGEASRLARIVEELRHKYPNDWLLRLEIIEIISNLGMVHPLQVELRKDLSRISKKSDVLATLIRRGLDLLH